MARSDHRASGWVVASALAAHLVTVPLTWGQQEAPAPAVAPGAAASAPPSDSAGPGLGREGILQQIRHANPLLWPLAACSVVVFGYILERSWALRRSRVLPKEFGRRFLERLAQGKLDRERALELCRANDSPLARVFGHVVRYWGQPAAVARPALDHDAAAEIAALRKNVRVLNGTATLAPLLGLLGTVVGMIESFDAVGGGRTAGSSRSEALAHGISLALVATAAGLAVAVLSVVFYYYFLQKVDALAHALDDQARQALDLISAEALRGAAGGRGAGLPHLHPGEAGPLEAAPPPRPRSLGRADNA